MRVYFYDNVLLPDLGLTHRSVPERQLSQVFTGVDQDYVKLVPASPNWKSVLTVETFVQPTANYSSEEFLASLDTLDLVLTEKSSLLLPVYVTKGKKSAVSVVGPPVVTSTPHGFSVGDRVLIVPPSPDPVNWGTVATVPSPTSFTFDAVVTLGTGNNLYRLSASYQECLYRGMTKPSETEHGNYYGKATFRFEHPGNGVWTAL